MWVAGLTITLLAACGGGGSSAPSTPPGMPTVNTVTAGDNQATITWDAVASATSYNIYRSTSPGQQGTKIGASVTTSFVDTTAINGTTYYYQLTADNSAGEGPISVQSPAATPAIPDTVPTAPSDLSATPGDAQVALAWTAVSGAKSYNVYRSTDSAAPGAKLGASVTTTYSDTSAANGSTYYYRVTAENIAGEGPASAQSSGVTPAVPVTAPAAPASVTATAGNAQVSVAWPAVTGASSYNIYRSTTQGAQGAKVGSSSTTAYVDATALNGTTYYYAVTADNSAGEGLASAPSAGVTPAVPITVPAPPTGVNALAGNAQVAVTWTAATGAASYNVYRSTSPGVQGSLIGASSTTSHTDSTAVNGTTYYYAVTAANAAGESLASTQSAAATPAVPVTLPAAPTSVNATAGNAQVSLSWVAAARASSYNVYRTTTQGALGSKIGSSAGLTYTDRTAVNGNTYYYLVTAVNAAGEGPASTQSAAATPAQPVVVPAAPTGVNVLAGNAKVNVSWTAATGATAYNIYRSTTQGAPGAKVGASSTTAYVDATALNDITYYYAVTAENTAGEGPASTPSAGVTPAVPITVPAPPTGVNALAGNAQVAVTWTAATGATSYNVYRSTSPGVQGSLIGAASTTSYTDGTAVNGTTYYYAVTAANTAGESLASAQSAPATPAVPVTLPAAPTGVNATAGNAQVSLSWAAAARASSYNVYRSTTQNSQGSKIGTSAGVTYTDSTAVNGKTYYYVVTAVNAAGEGPVSAQSAAATPTQPVVVPAAPTGVNVLGGNAQVSVSWTAVTGATSYNIYRSTTQGAPGAKVGASSTTAYVDATALNGTTYYYAVTADNAAGEGVASTPSAGVTPAAPITVPAPPTGVNVVAGNAQVAITWTAATGATSYNVYRATSPGLQGSLIGASSTTSYTDSTAVNAMTYYYAVTAANTAGESAASTQSAAATPAVPITIPAAPTSVNAMAGNAQVSLSWVAAARASSYNVYRSTTQSSQGSKIGTSAGLTYTDSTAVNGTTYYYVVTAVNTAGEGPASTQSAAAKPAQPVVVPAAPTGVNVLAGNAQVSVSWTAATGATSYNIYRSSSQGSQGSKLASSASTSYTDAAAVNGSTYYYVVTAVNSAGEGPASTQSAAATPAVPVTLPAAPTGVNVSAGNARVTVTWTAATGATSYNVYRSTTPGSQGSKISGSATATYTDNSALNGTTYYYQVTAVNAAGESPASLQSAAATPAQPIVIPAAPTGVAAARGITQVSVSWSAVSGATSYNVYRSTAQGTKGSLIGTSTTTSYADNTVVIGTVYYYSVTAANTAGESPASAQASVNTTMGWANAKFGGGGYVPGLIFHPTVANVLYARTDVAGAYRWDSVNNAWIALTDGFNNGFYGGVESMAVDPTDANKVYLVGGMYVNGGNGRLYRSSDRGTTWSSYVDLPFPTGGNNAGRAIGERLMVDPNLPTTLFYATRSQGLWKSTDSGANWNQVPGLSTYKMTSTPNGGDIGSVNNSPIGIEGVVFDTAVPPTGFVSSGTATQTLYVSVAPDYKGMAGLSSYLYKSTNGGTSWAPIAIPSAVTSDASYINNLGYGPYIPHMVRDSDATANRKIYMVFSGDTGPGAGGNGSLYSITGASDTWSSSLHAAPWVGASLGGLSVYGSGATTRIALGATNTWVGSSPAVYYSQNAGSTWTTIGDGTNTSIGWVDDVQINPFNPDNVLHVYGGGVWSTSDASSTHTWTETVNGIEELATRTLIAPPAGASYLFVAGYWDVGTQVHTNVNTKPTTNIPGSISFGNGNGADMAWTNPAYIAAIGSSNGNSGNNSVVGVYSTDSGVNWTAFATQPPFAPAGANVDQGSSGEANIAVTSQGKLVWAPSAFNSNGTPSGVPYYTINNGATWTATNLPPPTQATVNAAYHLAADRQNSNKVYAYDSGGANWTGARGKFYYSTDGGKTFTKSTDATIAGVNWHQFTTTWLAVNPNAEGDVWLADGDNVYHSTDSGVSWTKLSNMASTPSGYNQWGAPSLYGAQRIALGKPVPGASYSAAVYLVGTVGGVAGLFRSDDAGATWTRINDDAHQWGGVGALAASNTVAGRVYLAGRGVLYNY